MLAPTVKWLKVLSDATRLRLLRLLSRQELNVAELCEVLGVPQPTVSRHLAVLKESGLIRDRRDGPWVFYALDGARLPADVRSAWEGIARAIQAGADARRERDRLARVVRQRREVSRRFFDDAAAAARGTGQARFGDLAVWRSAAGLLDRRSTVLDLGTGTGDLLPVLSPRAGRVVALDFSSRMLAVARERAAALGLSNVSFVHGELEATPLLTGCADGVVASLVLHHAAEPKTAIAEMARLLKPGGRAVVVEYLPHREAWLKEEEADRWPGFDPADLKQWLQAARMTVTAIEEGPPPARSGRRDRPGTDRRLKRLRLFWIEAERRPGIPSPHTPRKRGARHGTGKVQHG